MRALPATGDDNAALGHWQAQIRRARITKEQKLLALTVASYASADGSDVRPTIARLAADCDMGYSTVRRHLKWLRETGLIRLVRAGNRRKALADEYQLTFSAQVSSALGIPTAAEYEALVAEITDGNRKRQQTYRDQRSDRVSAKPPEPEPAISAHPGPSAKAGLALTHERAPTSQVLPTSQPGGSPAPRPPRPPSPSAPGNESEKVTQRHTPPSPRPTAQPPTARETAIAAIRNLARRPRTA